jgi:4-alpha-glucanotransferase
MIRTALRHAGGIRVDHALGLDRLWVIPEGCSSSEGVYLSMPATVLKAIIAIEAHAANAVVIAEDLGTVPPGLRDDLSARGMLGMRVLAFEREANGAFLPTKNWDRDAVAMTGTHDTPTVAGWWNGKDIDWAGHIARSSADDAPTPSDEGARREIRNKERAALWIAMGQSGAPPGDPPLDSIVAHVASAPCCLSLIPLEDLIGAEEQPNLPGTDCEHPNWRRRMPDTTARLLADPLVAARTMHLTDVRPGIDP